MLKKQLSKTFKLIRKRKKVFLLLLLLQFIFFVSLTITGYSTVVPFAGKAQSVFSYVNTMKLDSKGLDLGEDPLQLYHDYKDALKYLKIFAIIVAVICLTLNNVIWGLANHLYKKMNVKEFMKYFLNYLIIKVSAGLILFFLSVKLLKNLFETEGIFSNAEFVVLMILLIAVVYMMFVFISAIRKQKIMDVVDKGLKNTIKLPVFLAFIINALLMIFVFALFYWLGELSLIIVFILIALLVLVFSWTKLFMITMSESV